MKNTWRRIAMVCGVMGIAVSSGCTVKHVSVTDFERPERPAELDHYDVFVGDWDWTAENIDKPDEKWTGTASWEWTLQKRCLRGYMSAQTGSTAFEATGIWSWHPKKNQYIWWMFNNWGYPQEGTAKFDHGSNSWTMDFVSIGLDGSTSHGRYTITVANDDQLNWTLAEWVDGLRTIKKFELKGEYKRKG